jgi:hypothetical protein
MNGVARIRVCWRFCAAMVRSSDEIHGNSQFRPVPSKIAL